MARQEELNEAWCSYRGKCSTELMQALAFALRWCDEHPNWISVEDELPKKYDSYLTCTSGNVIEITHYNIDGWHTESRGEVTHWMPLPALPKKGGE